MLKDICTEMKTFLSHQLHCYKQFFEGQCQEIFEPLKTKNTQTPYEQAKIVLRTFSFSQPAQKSDTVKVREIVLDCLCWDLGRVFKEKNRGRKSRDTLTLTELAQ